MKIGPSSRSGGCGPQLRTFFITFVVLVALIGGIVLLMAIAAASSGGV